MGCPPRTANPGCNCWPWRLAFSGAPEVDELLYDVVLQQLEVPFVHDKLRRTERSANTNNLGQRQLQLSAGVCVPGPVTRPWWLCRPGCSGTPGAGSGTSCRCARRTPRTPGQTWRAGGRTSPGSGAPQSHRLRAINAAGAGHSRSTRQTGLPRPAKRCSTSWRLQGWAS